MWLTIEFCIREKCKTQTGHCFYNTTKYIFTKWLHFSVAWLPCTDQSEIQCGRELLYIVQDIYFLKKKVAFHGERVSECLWWKAMLFLCIVSPFLGCFSLWCEIFSRVKSMSQKNPNDHNTPFGCWLFCCCSSSSASNSIQAPRGGGLGFRCCSQARSQNYQQTCSENGRCECRMSRKHNSWIFLSHWKQRIRFFLSKCLHN